MKQQSFVSNISSVNCLPPRPFPPPPSEGKGRDKAQNLNLPSIVPVALTAQQDPQ